MSLREWFRPPRHLLVILLLLTLVSVSALAWFAWKFVEQERIVEAQRSQEQMEQAADRIAATLRSRLAEIGERLTSFAAAPPSSAAKPEQGALLILTESTLAAFPPDRLLYLPYPTPEPEAPPDTFAKGESLEFLNAQPEEAVKVYRVLANSKDSAIRAGALMRLGRVLRRLGQKEESRAAYEKLAAIRGVRVAGAPAELVARLALRELSSGDPNDLKNALLAGRWPLNRGQFEFYWSEAARGEPAPAEAVALSEAAAAVWNERKNEQGARGQGTVWAGGHPWFLMWRGNAGRQAILLLKPETLLKDDAEVVAAFLDSEGRVLAGRKEGAGRGAVRTAAETQLPWTLRITGLRKTRLAGTLPQQRFLLLGIAVMVMFLMAGTYFIARAIRKEMEVSRLQSDFVSTVSHEFRSPLTSIRQLSEILALGRAPSELRRQKYYETLLSETGRLQRLVETLLNFGKMEAGARQYRFETVEVAELVRRVVAEFEPRIAESGRTIEVSGTPAGCAAEADPEALSLALRNLVDNALKYSPDQPVVWVQWEARNGAVEIRVRDQGMGIKLSEQKAIFEKFVRGSATAAGNVKGTGVGLAMVRHIVAAHGGEIEVASEPGRGSTFTIHLSDGKS